MLHVVFLWILSCGIKLGVIVVCLLPIRWILRKTAPRVFSYAMWSTLLINVAYNIFSVFEPNIISLVVPMLNKKTEMGIGERALSNGLVLYIIGTIVVWCAMVYSYVRLRRCLVGSIRIRENIYVTDRIKAPFSMGLFFPKIYMPYGMEEEFFGPVVFHERVHINRMDLWVKYLAVAFLGIFWFQPMLWFAYRLFINDMESACDETVLRRNEKEFREVYAKALVEVSYEAGKIRGAAIGYGSGEIFDRVQNVMKYQKPRKTTYMITGLCCMLVMIVLLVVSRQVPRVVQMERKNSTNAVNTLSVKMSEIQEEKVFSEE